MMEPFFGMFGLLAVFLPLLFWAVVIVVAVKLIKRSNPGYRSGRTSALQILEERYARSEINRDEFFERREVLQRRDA